MIVLSACEGINHNSQEGQRNERGEDHRTKRRTVADCGSMLESFTAALRHRHYKYGCCYFYGQTYNTVDRPLRQCAEYSWKLKEEKTSPFFAVFSYCALF